MKKLSTQQKEFILENFFTGGEDGKIIAEKLLDEQKCIVAGDVNIWKGKTRINEFITTERGDEYIGCLKYRFDLEGFLKSEYFLGIRKYQTNLLKKKKEKLEEEINEINKI